MTANGTVIAQQAANTAYAITANRFDLGNYEAARAYQMTVEIVTLALEPPEPETEPAPPALDVEGLREWLQELEQRRVGNA